MTPIGFIGLGNMGQAMALNLIKAGYKLRVYNRTADKAAPLVALGAESLSRPCEVEKGSKEAKKRVLPLLDVMGQGIFDFGAKIGSTLVVKLCGNFISFTAMEAMMEA